MTTNALNEVDLAFVVDTTGSMGSFIGAAQKQMIALLRALGDEARTPIDLHVALVEYRDHPPQDHSFVAQTHPFTGDLGAAQKVINGLRPNGGGDAPEAVYDGLHVAGADLAWRAHARRLAVLVGDAPPHGWGFAGDGFRGGCPCKRTLESITAGLEEGGVTLYAIGLTQAVRDSFAKLARYTGGDYFEAAQGNLAIDALRGLLAQEFADVDLDRRLLALCSAGPGWSIDGLSERLERSRDVVAASLTRLGQRGFLA
jgi:hypothetical protein